MHFTYDSYAEMIKLLRENEYSIADYHNCDDYKQVAVLRHDVDNDLGQALEFAKLEQKLGVRSTYFVLLSSNFYNVFSHKSQVIINQIIGMGHAVGLHFDETKYPISSDEDFEKYVRYELDLMGKIVQGRDYSLSMHRPSKMILEKNIDFSPAINSYSQKFFRDYKYLSDSRMQWREDVFQVIRSRAYGKLHILTHPFWYNTVELSTAEILRKYLSDKNDEMYVEISLNIRDIEEFLPAQPRNY